MKKFQFVIEPERAFPTEAEVDAIFASWGPMLTPQELLERQGLNRAHIITESASCAGYSRRHGFGDTINLVKRRDGSWGLPR